MNTFEKCDDFLKAICEKSEFKYHDYCKLDWGIDDSDELFIKMDPDKKEVMNLGEIHSMLRYPSVGVCYVLLRDGSSSIYKLSIKYKKKLTTRTIVKLE